MILELATHWLAETSEGIQESVLFGWELGTEFATSSSRRRERHSTQPTNGQSLRGVRNDATIKPVRNLYTYFGHATPGGPTEGFKTFSRSTHRGRWSWIHRDGGLGR